MKQHKIELTEDEINIINKLLINEVATAKFLDRDVVNLAKKFISISCDIDRGGAIE